MEQFEKNVQASFGYVKKDMLMLNDAISDMNDKIQHLSMNHAALLEKIDKLQSTLEKDEKKLKSVAKKAKAKKKTTKKKGSKSTKKRTTKKSSKSSPKKVVKTEEITYS